MFSGFTYSQTVSHDEVNFGLPPCGRPRLVVTWRFIATCSHPIGDGPALRENEAEGGLHPSAVARPLSASA
jgi:hypothetical protein